ncbi:hypothetical protein P280DRAFT_509002 [Massarina eburnea CBS 473.64]|uniref:Uncharacterized protein n=1 Tax=Massarina eburnea CBS 473.64 TaxID=1395130 RepID=A0A6A6RVI5_9PLEO|nr:hypothetical protein P280DRAFT_509002 [Massarina eburnea CBS 473.64]
MPAVAPPTGNRVALLAHKMAGSRSLQIQDACTQSLTSELPLLVKVKTLQRRGRQVTAPSGLIDDNVDYYPDKSSLRLWCGHCVLAETEIRNGKGKAAIGGWHNTSTTAYCQQSTQKDTTDRTGVCAHYHLFLIAKVASAIFSLATAESGVWSLESVSWTYVDAGRPRAPAFTSWVAAEEQGEGGHGREEPGAGGASKPNSRMPVRPGMHSHPPRAIPQTRCDGVVVLWYCGAVVDEWVNVAPGIHLFAVHVEGHDA